jgi:hypothetical protein
MYCHLYQQIFGWARWTYPHSSTYTQSALWRLPKKGHYRDRSLSTQNEPLRFGVRFASHLCWFVTNFVRHFGCNGTHCNGHISEKYGLEYRLCNEFRRPSVSFSGTNSLLGKKIRCPVEWGGSLFRIPTSRQMFSESHATKNLSPDSCSSVQTKAQASNGGSPMFISLKT